MNPADIEGRYKCYGYGCFCMFGMFLSAYTAWSSYNCFQRPLPVDLSVETFPTIEDPVYPDLWICSNYTLWDPENVSSPHHRPGDPNPKAQLISAIARKHAGFRRVYEADTARQLQGPRNGGGGSRGGGGSGNRGGGSGNRGGNLGSSRGGGSGNRGGNSGSSRGGSPGGGGPPNGGQGPPSGGQGPQGPPNGGHAPQGPSDGGQGPAPTSEPILARAGEDEPVRMEVMWEDIPLNWTFHSPKQLYRLAPNALNGDVARMFSYDPVPETEAEEQISFEKWMKYEGDDFACLRFTTSDVLRGNTREWKISFDLKAPRSQGQFWLLADSTAPAVDDDYSPWVSKIGSVSRSLNEGPASLGWPSQFIEINKVRLIQEGVLKSDRHEAFGGHLEGVTGFDRGLIRFELTFSPVTTVYRTSSHFMQMLKLLGTLGGFFTLMRISYGMTFPHRYKFTDQRTLFGHVDHRACELSENLLNGGKYNSLDNDSLDEEMSARDSMSSSLSSARA